MLLLCHFWVRSTFKDGHAGRKVTPALTERYTVIASDLRGCGASDRPESGYDKRTVASDVHELVRQLGLGPVNLVAHDVGMMGGYAYACAYRDEVRRLVLMGAALPGLGLEKLYDAVKYPRMYHLPLFEAPNRLAETLIAGRETLFVDHFMRQQSYDPDGIDAGHNQENARTRLAMPVMTMISADLAPEVKPLVERLHSVMIDECGHYLAEEQPARVVEELLRFFAA